MQLAQWDALTLISNEPYFSDDDCEVCTLDFDTSIQWPGLRFDALLVNVETQEREAVQCCPACAYRYNYGAMTEEAQ